MLRFNRRRLRGRKLNRPAPAAAPSEPIEMPDSPPANGASTEVDVQAVRAATAEPPSSSSPIRRQQDSTVELEALRPDLPLSQTSDGLAIEPDPPARLEFICPCGARLIATTEIYDKHSRCAMCSTVMLLSLVYDPEKNSHEIVPFRVDPDARN